MERLTFEGESIKKLKLLRDIAVELGFTIIYESYASQTSYTLEDKRLEHGNAYKPWTIEEDERLEMFYVAKKKIVEISKAFERNEGAIRSRIKKLDLENKYGK